MNDVSGAAGRLQIPGREGEQSPFRRFDAEFFTDDAAQERLQTLFPLLDAASEGVVDHGLVAASSLGIDLGTEPVEHLVVQPDRDPGLSRYWRDSGPSLFWAHAFGLRFAPE